jgi:hypothetical protein
MPQRHGHQRAHAERRQALRSLQHRVAVDLGAHVWLVARHDLAQHARRHGEVVLVAVAALGHRHERSLRARLVDDDRAAVGAQQLEAGDEHALEHALEVVLDADRARELDDGS